MKKIVLAIVVLSFIITGNAFALDENPSKRSTNMFVEDDDGVSIKALIGSDNVPIVDQADIRDPNFVGDRNFVTPTTQNQDRKRGIQSIKPPAKPVGPKSTITTDSPAAPDSSKAPSSILLDDESEKRPELSYRYENEKYRYEDSSGRECGDSTFSEMRHAQAPARATVPSGSVNPIEPTPVK